MGDDQRSLTIVVLPGGTGKTRTFSLRRRTARRVMAGALAALLLLGLGLTSIGILAARAWRAGELERQVSVLTADRARVESLAETLLEVEAAYERIRALYAPETLPGTGADWLPPAAGRPAEAAPGEEDQLPTSWPLTERGFITQTPMEGVGTEHPGIDIAVPTGSYIRAAGPARVVEAAQDPVYGLYLILDHGEGYRTLYAHASILLARAGDVVQRGEVIGLTGSTGRSTAPHLHFEILRDGEPIDPLTLVRQP
jgi:murein DD-endopeptidase MepM/ murein hydrolase activator NlpD